MYNIYTLHQRSDSKTAYESSESNCGPAHLNEASGGGESDQAVRSEVEFSCEGSASKAIREEVGLATCESGV